VFLDVPFKKVKTNIDIAKLRESLLGATEEDWYENTYRKESGGDIGKEVETILFKLNGQDFSPNNDPTKTHEWEDVWNRWEHLVAPIIKSAISGYDGCERAFVNKCLIPRMRPGTKILEHTDLARSFNFSHRIHVPIVTNPDVYFMIEDERCIMEEGNAYEINNKVLHSVENRGKETRIHLLFDIFIPSKNDKN
jgi:hypothetical protein